MRPLVLFLLAGTAFSQITTFPSASGGGSGTVTSVATGCGLSGGPITASGTIAATDIPSAKVGTSYTFVNGDCGTFITQSNAAASAFTLPQAGSGGNFVNGWFVDVSNIGAGTLTVTPTTSNIDGAANIALTTNQSTRLASDGTNYHALRGLTGGGGLPAGGSVGQIVLNTGSGTGAWSDYPDIKYWPAALCVNALPSTGWSTTGATPSGTCRSGTNNKDAFIGPWGASDTAFVKVHLPKDWSGAAPSVSIDLASNDATNAHTIIMQLSTACAKGDGTTTDDVAFNAAQSFSTITLNGTANSTWIATIASITTTGCAANGILWLKVSRTTDTATNVEVYGMTITTPRRLVLQAN